VAYEHEIVRRIGTAGVLHGTAKSRQELGQEE
jgi:hypothetical protein